MNNLLTWLRIENTFTNSFSKYKKVSNSIKYSLQYLGMQQLVLDWTDWTYICVWDRRRVRKLVIRLWVVETCYQKRVLKETEEEFFSAQGESQGKVALFNDQKPSTDRLCEFLRHRFKGMGMLYFSYLCQI